MYDYSHIGHARVYVAFDILYRTLMRLGYNVTYCRNFTDIDDKIIARAAERDEDPLVCSRSMDELPLTVRHHPPAVVAVRDIRNGTCGSTCMV